MGNWYANVAVRHSDQNAVVEYCRRERIEAFVSVPQDDWIFVYDRASNDMDWEHLEDLGRELSREIDCDTFGSMNADDDSLGLILHQRGELIVKYDSSALNRGGAWRLARAFRRSHAFPSIWIAMHRPYLFAIGRHTAIVRLLGVPEMQSFLGYKYVQEDDLECPPGFEEGLVRV